MMADLFMRFSWAFPLSVQFFEKKVEYDILLFFTSSIEVFRRAMWNLLRLENEHLGNCGRYRTTKAIPNLLPILKPQSHWKEKERKKDAPYPQE